MLGVPVRWGASGNQLSKCAGGRDVGSRASGEGLNSSEDVFGLDHRAGRCQLIPSQIRLILLVGSAFCSPILL